MSRYEGKPDGFRAAIRRELRLRDWPVSELVKRTGIHDSTVYRYLNRERGIRTDQLAEIFAVLDLAVVPRGER